MENDINNLNFLEAVKQLKEKYQKNYRMLVLLYQLCNLLSSFQGKTWTELLTVDHKQHIQM